MNTTPSTHNVQEFKSYGQLSQWEIERLEGGELIACDWCFEPGIYDPAYILSGIATSEFVLEQDLGADVYVCDKCEYKRELLHKIESQGN